MKKTSLAFLVILIISLLSACSDPVQDEILSYINDEMPPLADKENEVIDIYDSVTGDNYTDDETLYNALMDDIIPLYNGFIDDLEAVGVTDKGLRDIHENYIAAANQQNKAFTTMVTAIENQDITLVEEANEILAKTRREMRDYQYDIKEYAKENNVEISEE